MSEEEILEQPQSNSHPSDFNDLHVMSGLAEVRAQVTSGISSQLSAFDVSPAPPFTSRPRFGARIGSR